MFTANPIGLHERCTSIFGCTLYSVETASARPFVAASSPSLPLERPCLQGQTAGARQHQGMEECAQARRHHEFPLARLAARMGHVARDGRYDDGGTAGARRAEV